MTSRKLNEPQLKELRELLDVCDDLRKIFGSMGQGHSLTIPEIVVVGNQSVGKSSLLELLSGFRLPSGTGIVTRCPIVLQIRRGPRERYEVENQEVSLQNFANALFSAQNRLVSIECVENKSNGAEPGVDVTAKCVTTRIEGPRNRNITLVDLPGIQYSNTKLTGKIKNIIREYIKNPSAIILLVSQCSSDPTATEALQCAREVDANQERTVCVLTKPDELRIDDEPKMRSLLELVEGKHTTLNFPKGVFMTKARGGSEDEKNIEEIREIETKFFERHPFFKPCFSKLKQAGYENLMDRMEQLSLNSMRASLPKMKDDVKRELEQREAQVEKIDQMQIVVDDNQKRLILTGLFSNLIRRLQQNYESEFGKNLNDSLESFEIKIVGITKRCAANLEEDLSEYLRKRDPLRPSGVINQWCVDKYCSEFIDKLKAPANELFEAVHDIVHSSMMDAIEKEVERQAVRNSIVIVSEVFMRQFKKDASVKLKESFEFEDLYYFSQLARFYGPTVQMMKSLDNDFTFSGQIIPAGKNDDQLESSNSQSTESLNTSAATVPYLGSHMEESQKKFWRKGPPPNKGDKTTMYLPGPLLLSEPQDESSKSKDGDEPVFTTPGVNKNFLKSFLKLVKGSPTANARIVNEAETLVTEQETLHQKLETHFFYTGYRVAGNVGKLLLYHFRKKMPEDLKYRLDSSVMDLTESLNPDPQLIKQLNDSRDDIKQLQLAQQKITAAMAACKA